MRFVAQHQHVSDNSHTVVVQKEAPKDKQKQIFANNNNGVIMIQCKYHIYVISKLCNFSSSQTHTHTHHSCEYV